MIYDPVAADDDIKQGDIFAGVPRVDLSLGTLAVVDEEAEGPRQASWWDIREQPDITALLRIRAVTAIVVTQNCDAVRGEFVYLAQVDRFTETGYTQPTTPKGWQSLITRIGNTVPRYFYLPADETVGFPEPMAADFRVMLRIPRAELAQVSVQSRVGRLNQVAVDHFREKLAYFFRRYAFQEWYPLTREQFQAYAEKCEEPVKPMPWQE
jgi:hypothetical protein